MAPPQPRGSVPPWGETAAPPVPVAPPVMLAGDGDTAGTSRPAPSPGSRRDGGRASARGRGPRGGAGPGNRGPIVRAAAAAPPVRGAGSASGERKTSLIGSDGGTAPPASRTKGTGTAPPHRYRYRHGAADQRTGRARPRWPRAPREGGGNALASRCRSPTGPVAASRAEPGAPVPSPVATGRVLPAPAAAGTGFLGGAPRSGDTRSW